MHWMGWILTALGIAALDDGIKEHMEQKLPKQGVRPLPGGWLFLRKYHNRGAMLDLGNKKSKVICAISLFFTSAALILFLLGLKRPGIKLRKLGLSLLLGGALSNTRDRILRGYVVDYLVLGRGKNKPGRVVYNLSDFAIMVGAVCLAADALRGDGKPIQKNIPEDP